MVAGIGLMVAGCGGDDGGGSTGPTTGTVSGTVSASGTGVPGTALTLQQGQTTRTAASAADGDFTFSSIAAGAWTLGITPPTGFELAGGQTGSVPVTVTAGATTTVNVSLAAIPMTASIRATVTADGAAREDVTLNLFDAGGTTALATQTTDASGEAVFASLAAADFDVEVIPPGGFALAAGEVAKKEVTTTAGAEATVAFALVAEAAGEVTEITLSGTSFSDDDVTISAGETIRWINMDGVLHTVTPDGHSEWTSVTLDAVNEEFEHTFDTPGTYAYYCNPHQSQGMTGIIRVQ